MNNIIFCKPIEHKTHNFYIKTRTGVYFLFSQNYKQSVHNYYAGGVSIDNAISSPSGRKDIPINKTMDKLLKYLVYIEKEYELELLEKTKKRNLFSQKSA